MTNTASLRMAAMLAALAMSHRATAQSQEDQCGDGPCTPDEVNLLAWHPKASKPGTCKGQGEACEDDCPSHQCCPGYFCAKGDDGSAGRSTCRPRASTPAPLPTGEAHAVVLDCGSTNTRLRLYKLTKGPEGNPGITQIGDEISMGASLASLAKSPGSAGQALATWVNEVVENETDLFDGVVESETYLFAYATAGMRYVAADQSDAIWASVRRELRQRTDFIFTDEKQAQTISGDLEGVYQFLTVNPLLRQSRAHGTAGWYGIMELGGASLQFTFKPSTSVMLHEFQIDMPGGNRLPVYSNSWLGFGTDQALYRSCELLLARGSNEHPCLLKSSAQESYTITMYADSPKKARDVTFWGAGDHYACYGLVNELLHKSYECLQQPCSIMGSYTPPTPPSTTIVGVASMYWAAQMLGLAQIEQKRNLTKVTRASILERSEKFCSGDRADLGKNWPDADPEFAPYGCVRGFLVAGLMRAFQLDELDVANGYVTDAGEKADFTWTRGAAIYEMRGRMGDLTATAAAASSAEGAAGSLVPVKIEQKS